jgi:predicted nuclease of predicted toxin-antitoxin system
VKLLFDQNLSPRLVQRLQPDFPGSAHVRDFQLEAATDPEIWTFALREGYAILSKDSDFHQLAFAQGPPPKVVWIQRGNCTTSDIAELLRSARGTVEKFLEEPETAFLILE